MFRNTFHLGSRASAPVKRWRLVPLVLLAGGTVGLLPIGASATAVSRQSHSASSPLQQGLRFYRGKSITIIAPDAPGGGLDIYARAVGPVMGTYLHASVSVENFAQANTITGQDALAASTPDGLTIGMISQGSDIEDQVTGVPSTNFNPLRLVFLGAAKGGPSEFSCLEPSPYSTMVQVITAKTPVTEVAPTTGSQTITLKLINASFGFPTSIVFGYQNTKTEEAGFERGDGDCSALGIGNIGSYFQAGKAKILMNTGKFNPTTAFIAQEASAMSFQKLEKQFPAKTEREKLARPALLVLQQIGQEFNAPSKVSGDKVDALRAALKFAFANKTVQTELLAQGETIGFVDGAQCKLIYEQEYRALKHVASLLGS